MPFKPIAITLVCAGTFTLFGCSQPSPSPETLAEFFQVFTQGMYVPPADSFTVTKTSLKGIYAVEFRDGRENGKFYADATGTYIFLPTSDNVQLINTKKFIQIHEQVEAGELTPEQADAQMKQIKEP